MGDTHCVKCGSDATEDSIDAGVPLCRDHDSEIRREHVRIRTRLNEIASRRKTLNLHRSPAAGEATREHAERRMEELNHDAEEQRSRLADLQGRCDHPDIEAAAVGDQLSRRCPDCGHTEAEGWDPQPAELRPGETADVTSHAARNVEQIRQAERSGDLTHAEADEAVDRILED